MFSGKDLRKLIIPLIIEQLLGISVGMFDTIMISSLGDAAVSGVSLVDMINVLVMNIFAALATGGAVICAHELGRIKSISSDGCAKDYKFARSAAKQLLFVLFIASTIVALAAYFFRVQLLSLTFGGIDDDVMGHALVYFVISVVSFPFIAIYNGLSALFRTMGNSRVTMIASVIVNVLNVIGNALFIYVLDAGVAGAAWASTISRFIGMVILAVLIMNKKNDIYIDLHERFKVELATIKRILRIGIPGCFENSVFQLGRILVISMIAGFGTVQVAANAVANNLDALGCIPGQALSLATITVVGQCIGAGDYIEAKKYLRKLMRIAFVSMAILNTLIIVSLPLTLKLYNLSPEALKIATILIVVHDGFAIFMWPCSFVLPNALRAAQDVKYTMVVSVFSMVAFRILLSQIIGVEFGLGIIGVWIAMLFDWLFRDIMFIQRIQRGGWLKKLQQKHV